MAIVRLLGRTNLQVSPIGLGTNAVGGHNLFANLSDETGKDIVRTARNHEINFLDTAYYYGPEHSERLIGEVLKERGDRSRVVLATKGAQRVQDGVILKDNSPVFLRSQVEASLRRLQTDYIDLYYIHFPDEETPKDEAVGELQRLKEEGKIRAIGVSNFSLEQLKEGNKDGYIDVVQGEYHLLSRGAEQHILPYTLANNISFIPYFPLASGLLSGKYNAESIVDEQRKRSPLFSDEQFSKNVGLVEQLRPLADVHGVQIGAVVLAWYLCRPGIDAVIPGAKHPDQLLLHLEALKVKLTAAEVSHIDILFQIQ